MRVPCIYNLDSIVRRSLEEDRVQRDVTTQRLVGASDVSRARIMFKEKAVVCGLAIAKRVFQELDKNVRCDFLC